jgi:hypothetical protein
MPDRGKLAAAVCGPVHLTGNKEATLESVGCVGSLFLMLLLFLGFVTPVRTTTMQVGVATEAPVNDPRILAISANPPMEPAPTAQKAIQVFNETLDLVYRVGTRGIHLSDKWSTLEPSAGKYNLDDFSYSINYLANRGFTLQLAIQIINTTAKETPSDLLNMSFNSKKMKDRFHAFFDALAPRLNRHVVYLSIGNEVDVYLAIHDEWVAYKDFYDDAVAYVHKAAPWIKVGVTCTFDGAMRNTSEVARLNASSDVIVFTYYPLKPDFSVRDPDAPLTDFPKMIALAGGKPLVLQEVGYPTSTALASSEQKQADFVANVYAAWKANAGRIPFLNFFALHDFTPQMCTDLTQYYGLRSNKNFYEYLCTLELRKVDGTPKLGWKAFVDGAGTIKRLGR